MHSVHVPMYSFHVQCERTNAGASDNGKAEDVEKLLNWIVQDFKTHQRIGIMQKYAIVDSHQGGKHKTHKRGVKYPAFTNRGNPPNPGSRKHWRVHPARGCPTVLFRVGAPPNLIHAQHEFNRFKEIMRPWNFVWVYLPSHFPR